MGSEKTSQVSGVLLKIPLNTFGKVTVSLPFYSLITCTVTGILFQFEDVNETMCNVKNVIPSISGVTGVEPQRYIWRLCIALHTTPRFAVGVMYYNMYMTWISRVSEERRSLYKKLLKTAFWLYTIENACLLAVSAVSNKENYPVHEKIFVVFMICSLVYMLLTLIIFKWAHPSLTDPEDQQSYKWKKIYFITNLVSTMGLLVFFVMHRVYCVQGAFSFFSLCEYFIAFTNIGFHYTGSSDFRGRTWLVGCEQPIQTNNHKKLK